MVNVGTMNIYNYRTGDEMNIVCEDQAYEINAELKIHDGFNINANNNEASINAKVVTSAGIKIHFHSNCCARN